MRLSIKILLIITILLASCFGVLIWRSMSLMEKVVVEAVGKQQVQLASSTLDQMDAYLYERMRDIDTLSQVARVQAMLLGIIKPSNFQETINVISVMNGPWEAVSIVSKEGVVIASTYEDEVGTRIGDDQDDFEQYQKAVGGIISFSDKLVSDESDQEIMIFAAPVWQQDELGTRQIGVIIGHTAWPPLLEILAKVHSHAILFNKNGEMIAENSTYEYAQLKNAEDVLISQVSEKGQLDYGGNNWTLKLEYPKELVLAQTAPWVWQIFISFIPIVVAGIIVVLLVILKYVISPITKLIHASNKLGHGDFSQRVKISSRDELGQMGETFNQMAQQLGSRQGDLERQVAEKTKELQEKVEEVSKRNTELANLNSFMVGREMKMVELKQQLAAKQG